MNAPHKRDFATNDRLPGIALLAAVIGVLSTLAAFVLLSLIHLFTNLFFFQRFSFADHSPAGNTLGAWVIAVPVVALAHETCRLVATRLAVHGLERLPVVDDAQSLRMTGLVSRSDLIKPALQHFDDEHKRERFRPIVPANARKAG
ncbi:CBS domain-containing protein [Burkholderia ubonensis]|uniref:CBS domain-containing protein n=1 Tax=Burkholderia ubonensis TaxID=101571 RepID=UPI00016A444F|nr:CBS domain-containing protein [Burkholderia ubonensis]